MRHRAAANEQSGLVATRHYLLVCGRISHPYLVRMHSRVPTLVVSLTTWAKRKTSPFQRAVAVPSPEYTDVLKWIRPGVA